MRLATREQASQIDSQTQSQFDLSSEVLMESAGALAAREIANLRDTKNVVIVCGPGHNGGDGLVVARHLHGRAVKSVRVCFVGEGRFDEVRSPLVKLQLSRVRALGLEVVNASDLARSLPGLLSQADLIVDAIFGIGFRGPMTSPYDRIVEQINSAKVRVVSLDVPSGLNVDSGTVARAGQAVRADLTLTFGLAKPGFFVNSGPAHVGRLKVIPIGLPQKLQREIAHSHFLFTQRLAKQLLPDRGPAANKSNFGHALVLAGRKGFWGAGLLASTAAYRVGAGYVTWASHICPDEMLQDLPEVLMANAHEPEVWQKKFTAVALGPGLGFGPETAELIERAKSHVNLPVLLDADGITACVTHGLFPLPSHWVMTPHAGELARVLGCDAKEIEADRFQAVQRARDRVGCLILLKGFRSVLGFEDKMGVIYSGNVALAKAGTGDVLTGMIAGFLAQGLLPAHAALLGSYLHGRMADVWIRSGQDISALSASDLNALLPALLSRFRGAK